MSIPGVGSLTKNNEDKMKTTSMGDGTTQCAKYE